MLRPYGRNLLLFAILLSLVASGFASAYNAHPKLVVVIVVDQLREDSLERFHDEFGEGGFRLLTDHGAWFTSCYYRYANTRTGPGHASIATGTYTLGHGIMFNDWYEPSLKKRVNVGDDDRYQLIGGPAQGPGQSPFRLLTDTIGDELKMATLGKSRVYAISLKHRSAVLPGGFAADGAFWIDHESGAYITSTYYMKEAPQWLTEFNKGKRTEKYLNLEWKDRNGKVLGSTKPRKDDRGNPVAYYDLVGETPFANDYEFEFARELIEREDLGNGPATDLLFISLSANDILIHDVGPASDQAHGMMLALDRQLAEFFGYLGRRIGLANTYIALTSDHGGSPMVGTAARFRIPAANISAWQLRNNINAALVAKYGKTATYVRDIIYPTIFLSEETFAELKIPEAEAEKAAGEVLKQNGMRAYYTKSQLANNELSLSPFMAQYRNSYSPYGGWYVMGVPPPFYVGSMYTPVDHALAYSYDAHVPMAFFGLSFKPGRYRNPSEPIDLASTLASLLDINPPASASGRVLTESLVDVRPQEQHK